MNWKLAIALLFPFLLLMAFPVYAAEVNDTGVGQIFYVYSPKKAIHPEHNAVGYVHVIGLQDNTRIWIVDLAKNSIALKKTINRMEVASLKWNPVDAERYFKIVADKPIIVFYYSSGAAYVLEYLAGWDTFYPSTDGGFVGKEFIFVPCPGNMYVFGLEDSRVTVYDAKGALVGDFSVAAKFGATYLNLTKATADGATPVYRVVSTGKIMVSSWGTLGFTACPSDSGNFVGRFFAGCLRLSTADPARAEAGSIGLPSVAVFAYEPATVEISDIYGTRLDRKTLSKGEYWLREFQVPSELPTTADKCVKVESTGNIGVFVGHLTPEGKKALAPNGICDVSFAGGSVGKDFYILAPVPTARGSSAVAVVFAWTKTVVTVNGTNYTLEADKYLNLNKQGYYHITADNPVVVEVITEEFSNSGERYGSYLVAPSSAKVLSYPEEGISITAYAPYIGIAAVAAVVAVLFMKRRGKGKS